MYACRLLSPSYVAGPLHCRWQDGDACTKVEVQHGNGRTTERLLLEVGNMGGWAGRAPSVTKNIVGTQLFLEHWELATSWTFQPRHHQLLVEALLEVQLQVVQLTAPFDGPNLGRQ